MVKKCSTWALLNKYALKKWSGSSDPTVWGDDGVWRHTKIVLKGKIMFKRGQVEHILTMVNLKLKPSLFTPHPNVQNFHHIKSL